MTGSLTLLGTGTCQLEPDRMASSALIRAGDLHIVFDFGRGVCQRLVTLGIRQDDVKHVILSHFHPDHLSDLVPYLHAASKSIIDPRTVDLHIYGPRGLRVQLMRLLSLFGPGSLENEKYTVHLHEWAEGDKMVEGFPLSFISLPEASNHGLRFVLENKIVGLTGDSYYHEQEVSFLTGVDIAVIDAGHLTSDQIILLAARANPKVLVCSHLYRPLEVSELQMKAEKQGFSGAILMGRDLLQLI